MMETTVRCTGLLDLFEDRHRTSCGGGRAPAWTVVQDPSEAPRLLALGLWTEFGLTKPKVDSNTVCPFRRQNKASLGV